MNATFCDVVLVLDIPRVLAGFDELESFSIRLFTARGLECWFVSHWRHVRVSRVIGSCHVTEG